jgi:hypothetical protein
VKYSDCEQFGVDPVNPTTNPVLTRTGETVKLINDTLLTKVSLMTDETITGLKTFATPFTPGTDR